MGGGGLYTTPPDYLAFLQMLLHGGTFKGARVLEADTVKEMNRNQIGDIQVTELKTAIPGSSNDAEFFPGMTKRWGLGYMIGFEEAHTGRSAGSVAWAGLANTFFWIDSTRRLTGVILSQVLPFADERALRTFMDF